jgi:hypothetical protein
MRWFLILIAILFSFETALAQAVLVEEAGAAVSPAKEESKKGSYLVESRKFSDIFRTGSYDSVQAMRSDRRVGVGIETFGRLGVLGLDVELNYGPMDSATVGIGGGPGYNSFSLGAKHVFGGSRLSPYAGLSFTRWSGNSKTRFDGTTPAYLEDKFLTEDEENSGQFAKNFFVPNIGLQFNQLEGRSAGAVLFAEVLFLVDSSTMDYIPTGALGALYFF